MELFDSGDYNTNIPILFGNNKQEGVFNLGCLDINRVATGNERV